jgi:hypothetical protein
MQRDLFIKDDMNKLTLMLYMVGGDLERKSLAYTKVLLQVMKGISQYKSTFRETGGADDVAVIAETGGSCLDPECTVTGGVEDDAREKYRDLKQNFMDRLRVNAEKGSVSSADSLTKLEVLDKIAWDKNERWKIEDNELLPLQNPPKKEGLVLMTEKDEEGNVIELIDLLTEAVTLYPAEQYALIFCGHGGGPLWGFGEDERNDDDMIISADLCRMMPVIRELLGGKKLAFIGYNSCRMSHIEAVTAWAKGARTMIAAEGDEEGIGWMRSKTIETLLAACHGFDTKLTDSAFDKKILPILLDKIYVGLDKHEGLVLTSINLDENIVDGFKNAFNRFCRCLAVRMREAPGQMYRLLAGIRDKSQKIDEYSVDLGLWARNLAASEYLRADKVFISNYEALAKSIREMIIRLYASPEVFSRDISGISLFFPNTDSTTDNSNFEKYLFSHRVSHRDGFKTWPFHGYVIGLAQPGTDEEAQDFCPEYDYLKDGYWELAALYNAMREAARLMEDNENSVDEIYDKIKQELFIYGKSYLLSESDARKLATELLNITDGVFEQDLVVRYIYEGDEGKYSRNRGLGYLPLNKCDGGNLDDGAWWFWAKDGNSRFFVHVYGIEGRDYLNGDITILVPVLLDSKIFMLRVRFDEGAAHGQIEGYYRYYFQYDRITDYISGDAALIGKEIAFPGSVSEGARYEMTFDNEKAENFVIGTIRYGKDSALVRDRFAENELPSQYESISVKRYRRDVFGNKY